MHCLHHPITIASVLLLLFNDHWLRHSYPSWLTGKLGDFTWLIFAPFITAMLISVIFPQWSHKRIGILSFMFIGLWFATAKTIPAIHHLTTSILHTIIGWEGTLRIDPTDLLTLPALPIGWIIWQRADDSQINLRSVAVVMFGLGILGTLASDSPSYPPYTDYGIQTICQQGTELITTTPESARGVYEQGSDRPIDYIERTNVYTSYDGGETWSHRIEQDFSLVTMNCSDASSNLLVDPNNEDTQYRWQAKDKIEESLDGGETWRTIHNLRELKQDVRLEYNHRDQNRVYSNFTRLYEPSPISGWLHEETGNLLFAMSQDGILLRTPENEWHWIELGNYRLAEIRGFDRITGILFFELWLAGALVFLIVTSSAAYIHRFQRRGYGILLMVSWIAWIVFNIMTLDDRLAKALSVSSPDMILIDDYSIAVPSFLALIFLAIPLSLAAIWDIGRNFRPIIKHLLIAAPIPAVLYLLPFLLWSQGTIPPYATAFAFAMGLALIGTIAAWMYLRRVLPTVEKLKKKNDEKAKIAQ